MHPERFALIEKRFEKHGNWAIFTCRFLPGLRLPGFFGAGSMGMSYWRFLLFDAMAACIMVPIYVYLGSTFARHIGRLEQAVKDSTATLGFVLLVVLCFVVVGFLCRRRERQVAKIPGQENPDPKEPDPPSKEG